MVRPRQSCRMPFAGRRRLYVSVVQFRSTQYPPPLTAVSPTAFVSYFCFWGYVLYLRKRGRYFYTGVGPPYVLDNVGLFQGGRVRRQKWAGFKRVRFYILLFMCQRVSRRVVDWSHLVSHQPCVHVFVAGSRIPGYGLSFPTLCISDGCDFDDGEVTSTGRETRARFPTSSHHCCGYTYA